MTQHLQRLRQRPLAKPLSQHDRLADLRRRKPFLAQEIDELLEDLADSQRRNATAAVERYLQEND